MNYKKLSQLLRYSGPTTEEDFHTLLDKNPNDHQTRMILADYLQEHNDPRAEGYRALGKLTRYPNYWIGSPDHPTVQHPIWSWGTKNNELAASGKVYEHYSNILPHDWMSAIPHQVIHNYGLHDADYWRYHLTRREADDAAALAFSKLPPERRKELLK